MCRWESLQDVRGLGFVELNLPDDSNVFFFSLGDAFR